MIQTPPFARQLRLERPFRQDRWPARIRRWDRALIRAERAVIRWTILVCLSLAAGLMLSLIIH